ncbi:MAG: metal-dependent transcriptional regulator [Clostridiales bacterium]|jgi:DtxR family Mn-dependent transcriptional regulator|nr:metal-dependent transcriptional regulator [Clostridiales bacterium]
MAGKKELSSSLEDYLKAIYFLHKGDSSIRLVDIADQMSVSKPSAFGAISQLAEQELVVHEKFGPVRMTDKGIEAAKLIVCKHEIIKRFLMSILDIGEKQAGSEACAIEHTICDDTLAKMAEHI